MEVIMKPLDSKKDYQNYVDKKSPNSPILKNCFDDPREIAATLAERTRSEVVQVVGKKITLYKEAKNEKKRKAFTKVTFIFKQLSIIQL